MRRMRKEYYKKPRHKFLVRRATAKVRRSAPDATILWLEMNSYAAIIWVM